VFRTNRAEGIAELAPLGQAKSEQGSGRLALFGQLTGTVPPRKLAAGTEEESLPEVVVRHHSVEGLTGGARRPRRIGAGRCGHESSIAGTFPIFTSNNHMR
jgi:hypothetical protein